MPSEDSERVVDKEYLALLEKKLHAVKDSKQITGTKFLSDIAAYKDHQLFRLITSDCPASSGFEDDFASIVITPSYLRRVIAPQTCAISKQELAHLVRNDFAQKAHEAVATTDETEA